MTGCPFCAKRSAGEAAMDKTLAFALADVFPVSSGHTLVLPQRHVSDYFALTTEEKTAIWQLVNRVRDRLLRDHQPDGFNLGVNSGQAAGRVRQRMPYDEFGKPAEVPDSCLSYCRVPVDWIRDGSRPCTRENRRRLTPNFSVRLS